MIHRWLPVMVLHWYAMHMNQIIFRIYDNKELKTEDDKHIVKFMKLRIIIGKYFIVFVSVILYCQCVHSYVQGLTYRKLIPNQQKKNIYIRFWKIHLNVWCDVSASRASSKLPCSSCYAGNKTKKEERKKKWKTSKRNFLLKHKIRMEMCL